MARSRSIQPARWRAHGSRRSQHLRELLVARHRPLALGVTLIIAFLLGGSSRADASQLVVLRPLSMLILGYALYQLRTDDIRANLGLVSLAAGTVLLVAAQLVPLPPDWWQRLPGRDLVVDISREAGIEGIWRPLSLTPAMTRNALWSLGLPVAVGCLTLSCTVKERDSVLVVLIWIGLATCLIGLLQILGDPQGPLYLYSRTYNGLPVGLLANRNHQATFVACLIPVGYGVFESWRGVRPKHRDLSRAALAALALTLFAVIILLTGSRAGTAVGLTATAALPLLAVKPARQPAAPGWRVRGLRLGLTAVAFVLAIGAVAFVKGRALSFDRWLAQDEMSDMRVKILPTVRQMLIEHWPWGSGFGSFEATYQVHEPAELLAPFYMNHAHNDWLEIALDGGLAAVLLATWAIALVAFLAFRRERSSLSDIRCLRQGRIGLVILLLLSFASIVDYPLRTPALASVLAFALVLATHRPDPHNDIESEEKIDPPPSPRQSGRSGFQGAWHPRTQT